MSDTPRRLTRPSLNKFAGDPRTLRALEQVLTQAQAAPDVTAALTESIIAALTFAEASSSGRRVAQPQAEEQLPQRQQSRGELHQILQRLDAVEAALRSSRAVEAALRREIEDLKQLAT